MNDIQNVSDASHEQSIAIQQMQFNLEHSDQAVELNQQQAASSKQQAASRKNRIIGRRVKREFNKYG
ncbi:MAG: hypothetical protein HRU20_16800 [Pseudomonadales bacterium]|nr:hypothetical protein [Pseudomonadales bacterium]